ncbi:MAG TPA: hypothetical protein PK430_11150 [Muribaculum sp.]|jgi:chromosome segregation ATPase|uniref:Uncharacterized protein n=1 Tax=Heminiphilus faecis TaxID=2601703 RepID=A0ABV4CYR9_9BACT|nr:hypothetical protein [Heminiphilus faecis]RLT75931.1 hypothetical protein D7V95_11350 [bacterium J10(2018)]HRF69755.1 hypothetical protein [Muribaculum sp.]
MASDLQQTLQRISRKTEFLTERYNEVLRGKTSAEARVKELEQTVTRLNEEIRQLKSRIEYLTVVTIAHPDRRDVESSRAKLTKLVREIDRCISELSE